MSSIAGSAVIRALEKPDVSTAVHELAHVFRRDLEAPDLEHVEKWAGVEDGKWTTAAEEKFARGFERYLRDGKAPTDALRNVFEQFKQWLTAIYSKIKGSAIDVKLTPEVKATFDRLLGESAESAPASARGAAPESVSGQQAPAETKPARRQPKRSILAEEETPPVPAEPPPTMM